MISNPPLFSKTDSKKRSEGDQSKAQTAASSTDSCFKRCREPTASSRDQRMPPDHRFWTQPCSPRTALHAPPGKKKLHRTLQPIHVSDIPGVYKGWTLMTSCSFNSWTLKAPDGIPGVLKAPDKVQRERFALKDHKRELSSNDTTDSALWLSTCYIYVQVHGAKQSAGIPKLVTSMHSSQGYACHPLRKQWQCARRRYQSFSKVCKLVNIWQHRLQ